MSRDSQQQPATDLAALVDQPADCPIHGMPLEVINGWPMCPLCVPGEVAAAAEVHGLWAPHQRRRERNQ